jgi:hypothetical protein
MFMDCLRRISYLGLVLGFILLLAGAFTASYVSGWQKTDQNPALLPVYPFAKYSILLMVPGAILVILGIIYRWKS